MLKTSKIAIGSHRGLSNTLHPNIAPNTIASFETLEQQHADYIECDCIMTTDNAIILYHDPLINNKPIIKQTLNSLHKHHPNIETLDSLLKILTSPPITPLSNKTLCLELKFYESEAKKKELFATTIIKTLVSYNMQDSVIIVSFDPDLLYLIYKQNNQLSLGLNLAFQTTHPTCFQLTQKALDHPILSTLTYCCPHIDDINHPKLPTLPKLVWESENEDKILNYLIKLDIINMIKKWCSQKNIHGFTTNTVEAIYKLFKNNSLK
tara:strand:- start:807 stop:1601 length:795 start_codon:yes stop_codon:yes gene_type:complete